QVNAVRHIHTHIAVVCPATRLGERQGRVRRLRSVATLAKQSTIASIKLYCSHYSSHSYKRMQR
ncbi:unnamed protein product, partial [Callosobruchus maculatus]